MLFFRRFPGVVYKHRYAASTIFFFLFTIIYFLFHWGFVCSNLEPWNHVKNLCQEFRAGRVVGDLCTPLCSEGRVSAFSCHSLHAGKQAVFSAVKDGSRLVIKLARQMDQPSVFWVDNGKQRFPTEEEFMRMIVDHVSSRLNTTITSEQGSALGRFGTSVDTATRPLEMQELWTLLQDNEYLLTRLYAHTDVFPHLLGSCGQYYAAEWLDPAIDGHVGCITHPHGMHLVVSDEGSWASRVKLAVLILDLLQEIENFVSEGFSLCDVKPSHFGVSPTSGKVKFVDLDVALPRTIVNSVTADGSSCRTNADCSLFDCRSRCDADSHRCENPQTNDNLQIVCEKIFLGWTVSGSVIMPGLLMAPQTPSTLASLLRQCADADSFGVFSAPSEHVRERLTATLQEMDKSLSLDSY